MDFWLSLAASISVPSHGATAAVPTDFRFINAARGILRVMRSYIFNISESNRRNEKISFRIEFFFSFLDLKILIIFR